ncbi:hypothetical protein BYT27DRAFT_7216909 [Phlegmacium glaucopus]|nr:hypothetical protein BYT27DRAFT_7216909 [Phlegmacium glaucopus]
MCNRPIHPPHPEALANAAARQSYGHQLKDDDLEADENEDDDSSTHRACHYSKTPRDAEPKPTTMNYYPPGWQTMLEMVKNNMRRHVALVNAFPQRDRDLKEATLILNNTVFNEHSSFRQKLKKVIWGIMLAKYSNLLCPPEFEGGNQQEEYDLVQQAVHKSLKEGLFLRGREDENGKCKNIAHPAIPAVIHEFFYTNKDCLAALYHQDFEHTIPDYAIALIQNCLEEYTDYGYRKPITLDRETYRVVMKHHLHLIDTLKGHAYHGARYEACRAKWARKGMQLLEQDEAPVARYAPALQLD